jgi:hypothetical protein
MPLSLYTWAARHGVTRAALDELRAIMIGTDQTPNVSTEPGSEAAVQNNVRLLASAAGGRLFRNNVGVLRNEAGVPIRFGLANDSGAVNAVCKSSDLIGIWPLCITPDMIGHTIGQFWSIECKRPGWTYSGNTREAAQLKWLNLVTALGGKASFSTGEL